MIKNEDGSIVLSKEELQELNIAYQSLYAVLDEMGKPIGDYFENQDDYVNIMKWQCTLNDEEFRREDWVKEKIRYFKLSMKDAGIATEKVWEAQTKAGLKKSPFHISGSLEVSVWTKDHIGEIMLRGILKGLNIEYEEGHEQQVKTFIDEYFGSIDKERE